MGCVFSLPLDKVEALRRVMEPRFADLLTRDDALKKYVRAAFPAGLRESVPKEVLFGALRLEVGVLEDRLYTLLERDCTGVVCLEDVLRTLAAAAAGDTLRVTRRMVRRGTVDALPPMPLPATAWEENDAAGLVDNLRANFAFDLYDLDGNGSLAAEEVVQLVTRTMGGNARTVNSTLRAIGVLRDGQKSTLRRLEFVLMCEKAPNFMYPAFALQEALVRNGGGAAEALEQLRMVLRDAALPRRSSAVLAGGAQLVRRLSDKVRHSVTRRRSSVTFNFGAEGAPPAASPAAPPPGRVGPARPARSALRGAREASRSSSSSPRVNAVTSPAFSAAATPGGGASSSSQEGLVARAFRAARLGRTEEVEAAISRDGVSADVAFEPHRATLLHVAAAHGHRALCRRLLALGAPPRARDALGRTAAEVALAYRHWAAAEALQAAGVPVSPTAAAHAAAEQQRWRQQQQQSDAAAYAQAAAAAHSPWPHQTPPPPGWGAPGMPSPAMAQEPWQQSPALPRGRLDFGWGDHQDAGLAFGISPAAAAAPPWQQDAWGFEQQQPQPQQRDARGWDAGVVSQDDDGFTEWAAQPAGAQARVRAEARTQGQLSEQDEMAGETGGPADQQAYRRRRGRA